MRCSRFWTSLLAGAALAAAPVTAARAQQGDLPPAGHGTLRQDQVGVRIVTPTTAVRVLPLDERVIRLLAPDAYRSLHELTLSRAADIAQAARSGGHDSVALFMVTFFGLLPQTQFSPDQVYVTSQAREYRPIGIVPLTPGFAEARLEQRQQAAAIYLFESGIEVLRPFAVSYGVQSSEQWNQSLRLLDAERARVWSRARQAAPQPATPE
jgi:hypothetical protein